MNSDAVNNWGEQTSANFLAADRTCDNDSLMESISKKIDQFPRWHINDLSRFVISDKEITAVRSQSLPRDIYLHKTQLSRRKLSFVAKSSFVGIYLVGPKCVSLEFFFGNERR